MPNMAALLKAEITRLAKKELRKEVIPLRKTAAAHRREIAQLKRMLISVDRRTKQIAKQKVPTVASIDQTPPHRFVAKGLVSLRKRLGLSAAELARLLGVSMQSVYNWERKKATPRREQIAAIVALRSMSKKEARTRLGGTKSNQNGSLSRMANRRRSTKSPPRKQQRRIRARKRARQ